MLNDKGDIEQYNLIYLKNNIKINKIVLDDLLKDESEFSSSNLFSNYYKIDKKNSSKDEMLITKSMKDNFEKKLRENELSKQEQRIKKGNCYDEDNNIIGNNKEDCNGIWDYIPRTSQECPYNESNKNYPNNFGKLVGDFCEFPNNMKIIGYRNFSKDPKFLPVCYNCKSDKRLFANNTLGFCCNDQKDKSLYPNLVTPDYVFKDDEDIRENYKDQLSIQNLSYK